MGHVISLRRPASALAGFTFIEVLVVMALMGLLMGIGVGYLTNIGRGSQSAQARAVLRETAFACKQSSNGGTRAILDLRARPQDGRLVVGAAVARPVLTHNFEAVDFVSGDYPLEVQGAVEVVPDGYTGGAGRFKRGGRILFEPQSRFAMTEGVLVSLWVRPDPEGQTMTLLTAEGAWDLSLVQDAAGTDYAVRFRVQLRGADDERSFPEATEFKTRGAPVRADGQTWTHVRAGFDGASASIRVNGLEMLRTRTRPTSSEAEVTPSGSGRQTLLKTIAIPEGGAVVLSISDLNTPFVGSMDELVLGGVFRSSEMERDLTGLELVRPALPVRLTYRNGRLDPDEHTSDVVLVLREAGGGGTGTYVEFRLGLYGTVEEQLVSGGPEGGAP